MASHMAMRTMSPCEGVKPARGPDEACLRSPGGLNPVLEVATTAGEPAQMKCVRACHPKAGPTPREDQGVGGWGKRGQARRKVARALSQNGNGRASGWKIKMIMNAHK